LAYAAAVWWAIVFTGDHYVVDVLAGIVYAGAAYLATPRIAAAVGGLRRRPYEATG
jgi:hypothetical protein